MTNTVQYAFLVAWFTLWFSASADAQASCPSDWVYSEQSGTCVKLFTDSSTWEDSMVACQAEGGDLVKIVNEDMNDFIVDEVANGKSVWIGLNDLGEEGTWVWLNGDTVTETNYTDWYPGHPDMGSEQNCVAISVTYDNQWIDNGCDYELSYICEIPGIESTASCPSDWTYSEQSGTCVKLFTDSSTWEDSREACQAEGGNLVKIVNEDMNDFIVDEVANGKSVWIGLNDLGEEGTWVWLDGDTVTETNYTDWYPGDPDMGSEQNCVAISVTYDNQWIDNGCDYELSYICEIPGIESTASTPASDIHDLTTVTTSQTIGVTTVTEQLEAETSPAAETTVTELTSTQAVVETTTTEQIFTDAAVVTTPEEQIITDAVVVTATEEQIFTDAAVETTERTTVGVEETTSFTSVSEQPGIVTESSEIIAGSGSTAEGNNVVLVVLLVLAACILLLVPVVLLLVRRCRVLPPQDDQIKPADPVVFVNATYDLEP